tara:strand:- start:490 stop:720 length:231 start_codon:yes stop_codon:yes gene_type:complete
MVFGPVMLHFDWYWDQLLQYYGGKLPMEIPDYYFGRVEAVVACKLAIVPMYSTDDNRNHHGNLKLAQEGEFFGFDY